MPKKIQKANLLNNLRAYEVSLVDNGAIGEVFTIVKRAPDEEDEIDKEFSDIKKSMTPEEYQIFKNEYMESISKALGDSESEPNSDKDESVFKTLIHKAFESLKGSNVQKADVATVDTDFVKNFKNKMIRNNLSDHFWSLTDSLRETVYNILESEEADKNKIIADTLVAFSNAVISLTSNSMFTQSLAKRYDSEEIVIKSGITEEEIEKIGKKISADRLTKLKSAVSTINEIITDNGEEIEMKPEELQNIIQKALEPVTKSINDISAKVAEIEKTAGTENAGTEGVEGIEKKDANTRSEVNDLSEAITKALEPITKSLGDLTTKVQAIEKSTEPSRKLTNELGTEPIKKSAPKWPTFSK